MLQDLGNDDHVVDACRRRGGQDIGLRQLNRLGDVELVECGAGLPQRDLADIPSLEIARSRIAGGEIDHQAVTGPNLEIVERRVAALEKVVQKHLENASVIVPEQL